MDIAAYNQFRQEVDDRHDREDACWEAQQRALKAGHSGSCKWVEVLGHQSAADVSWCDCKKKRKS